jgi:enoyl-CoA hydratase/carnithine racemase
MDDVIEEVGSISRVQLNRPTKRNAMTVSMHVALARIFNQVVNTENMEVVLSRGAGDSFCADNDVGDFSRILRGEANRHRPGLMNASVNFDKPIVVAVHGAAIGGGTTMLTHCDFVYAGESTKFQMPIINLAVVPEFVTELLRASADWSCRCCGADLVGSSL